MLKLFYQLHTSTLELLIKSEVQQWWARAYIKTIFINFEVDGMSVALVVDDTLTQLEIISSCLRKGGFTVVTAGTGEEALALINAQKPDIIILDVVLPGRSGFEVCRDLKADENTKQIPIILFSTKGSDMDKFWGMKQGANAYIPKPVDQEQLLQTIKQLVKG